MRKTSLADGECMSRIFQTKSLSHHWTHGVHLVKENNIAAAEVLLAVRTLKTAYYYEIQPEMFKDLHQEGVLWLIRGGKCQVASCSRRAPKDWQTGVNIPVETRVELKDCRNYCGITLFNLPEKVNAYCLEKRTSK